MTTDREYLGDGVYAAYDGYHIILTTGRGDNRHIDTIFIDPYVLDALTKFAARKKAV
jgi:hypothetical protein